MLPVRKILRISAEVEVQASDEAAVKKAEAEVRRLLQIDRGTIYKGGEYAVRSTGVYTVEEVEEAEQVEQQAPKKKKGAR